MTLDEAKAVIAEHPLAALAVAILGSSWALAMLKRAQKPQRAETSAAAAPPTDTQAEEIRKGRKAIVALLKTNKPQLRAMNVPGIGAVDFVPGFFNPKSGSGNGADKIKGAMAAKWKVTRNPAYSISIFRHIPEILMRGKRTVQKKDFGGDRIMFSFNSRNVILQKPVRTWLFNAFPDVEHKISTKKAVRMLKDGKEKRLP
jgi:hypothetical protein